MSHLWINTWFMIMRGNTKINMFLIIRLANCSLPFFSFPLFPQHLRDQRAAMPVALRRRLATSYIIWLKTIRRRQQVLDAWMGVFTMQMKIQLTNSASRRVLSLLLARMVQATSTGVMREHVDLHTGQMNALYVFFAADICLTFSSSKVCNGTSQSPINIITGPAAVAQPAPLSFQNYEKVSLQTKK